MGNKDKGKYQARDKGNSSHCGGRKGMIIELWEIEQIWLRAVCLTMEEGGGKLIKEKHVRIICMDGGNIRTDTTETAKKQQSSQGGREIVVKVAESRRTYSGQWSLTCALKWKWGIQERKGKINQLKMRAMWRLASK